MQSERVLRAVLFLIVAELLLGGLAAALNRTLVEMPAWHHLGAGAWATFSRMADLGNGECPASTIISPQRQLDFPKDVANSFTPFHG
jgi:hypothetical protein